jgi:uncharacterized protein YdaU (DUF1376 family)
MTAKANPHWYPRFYKDYQLDTSHLSMLEHGAYTLLLDHYYLTGKPLMANITAVARQMRCMMPEEIEAVKSVLEQFFDLQDDGWHNRRADEELMRRAHLIDTRRRAASHGGKMATAKSERMVEHMLKQMPEQMVEQMLEHEPEQMQSTLSTQTQTHTHTHTQTEEQKQSPAKPKQSPAKTQNLPAPLDAGATGSQVWNAYEHAYVLRYGIEPVRNAKNNALCKQLVARLGVDAPEVAAFFVAHSAQFYVLKGHSLTLLVADAEKLRTEWATGQKITATAARQADRTQATGQVFAALIAEQGAHRAD